MRIIFSMKVVKQGKQADLSYEFAWMGMFAYAEISLGLIVACALALPKLLRAKGAGVTRIGSFVSRVLSPFATGSGSTSGSSVGGEKKSRERERHSDIEARPDDMVFLSEPSWLTRPAEVHRP
jgi:hypothetical protein